MIKRCFPDVNVWLALAVEDHPHNAAAMNWWNQNHALTGFSRITQISLLRLLTTNSVMGGAPLSNAEAWDVFDSFAADERVRMFSEPAALDDSFRLFSTNALASPKIWVDSYLAACAMANRAALVTFDPAFRNFDVEQLILS